MTPTLPFRLTQSQGKLFRCLLLGLCFAYGCKRVEPESLKLPPKKQAEAEEEQAPAVVQSEATTWLREDQRPWEAFQIQYLAGKRVGYSHVMVSKSEEQALLHIKRTSVFEVLREGDPVLLKSELVSTEYLDNGKLASFSETISTGNNTTQVAGKLESYNLAMTTTNANGKKKSRLKWEPGTWGVLDVQSILLASPMKPGEIRTAKVFVPTLRKIVDATLAAGNAEITSLPGGTTPELVPVEVVMISGETRMRSRNWINESGEVLKSISLDGPMSSSFRTSREVGERIQGEYQLKELYKTACPFSGQALTPAATTTEYLVEGSGLDLYAIWARNTRQKVTSLTALSTKIVVGMDDFETPQLADSSGETVDRTQTEPPGAEFLADGPLLQTQHAAIEALAIELAGDATAQTQIALQLARGLFSQTKKTEFDAGINSALVTARQLEGDFVDHSLLLTSLLRNRGIPSRVAYGIRVNEKNQSASYYMWVEAWIGERWASIDAMTGRALGLNCIKMKDSSVPGDNAYPLINPILEMLPKFSVSRKN